MSEQANLPATRPERVIEMRPDGPIGWLREEIDRLFDDFPFKRPRNFFGFPAMPALPLATFPALEMVEKDSGYQLSVELPGMEEKDINIELAEGVLTISGEKRDESETKDSGCLISERSYGAFRRQITLPSDVDPNSLQAKVRQGVLKLDMKKDKNAASKSRKIPIG